MNVTLMAIIIAALLAAGALVGIVKGRKKKARPRPELYTEALRMMVEGEDERAFELLSQAVHQGTAPVDAYLRLGTLLRKRGQAAQALQLHQSLTVKGNLPREEKKKLYRNLAEDYEALGRIDNAIRVMESAIEDHKLREPDHYQLLARLYSTAGRSDRAYDAMKEMRKAGVVDEGRLALFLATSAEKHLAESKLKEAKKDVDRALKHDPSCAPALLVAGDLKAKEGRPEEAVESWKKAVLAAGELVPDGLEKIEQVLFERGRFGEMAGIYREVLTRHPNEEKAVLRLARFYHKQGMLNESESLLEDFVSSRPASLAASFLLIATYARRNKVERIAQESARALAQLLADRGSVCPECGYEAQTMRWHCPRCNSFHSFTPRDGRR